MTSTCRSTISLLSLGLSLTLGAACATTRGAQADAAAGQIEFEKGKKAYDAEAYGEAFRWLKKSAEHGNPRGEYYLSKCYLYARGVRQSYTEASRWEWKAEDEGIDPKTGDLKPPAQVIYQKGEKAFANDRYEEALGFYQRAAVLGDPRALYGEARALERLGDAKKGTDDKQACAYYEKSGALGDGEGTKGLADCYLWGMGTPKDVAKAIELYKNAMAQGSRFAANALGDMYEHGYGVEVDLQQARDWYARSSVSADDVARLDQRLHPVANKPHYSRGCAGDCVTPDMLAHGYQSLFERGPAASGPPHASSSSSGSSSSTSTTYNNNDAWKIRAKEEIDAHEREIKGRELLSH